MARAILTGDKAIERMLRRLAEKSADRVARAAVSAGLTQLTKAIRNAAPVGETGALRKSIGRRFERTSGGKYEAKAGINVGKRTTKSKSAGGGRRLTTANAQRRRKTGSSAKAPHGHLVALGTKARFRNQVGGKYALNNPSASQLSTGRMPANNFVQRATNSSKGKVYAAMIAAVKRGLEREAARSRKG